MTVVCSYWSTAKRYPMKTNEAELKREMRRLRMKREVLLELLAYLLMGAVAGSAFAALVLLT